MHTPAAKNDDLIIEPVRAVTVHVIGRLLYIQLGNITTMTCSLLREKES